MGEQLRNKLNNCENRNKGFSLVELLATIGILCILLAAGAVAYASWQKSAEFNYNNETARTIYSALQSELSEKRANNSLDDLQRNLKEWSASEDESVRAYCGVFSDTVLANIMLADITLETVNDYGEGMKVKLEAKMGTSYNEIYSGFSGTDKRRIYYLKATAADWKRYLNDDPEDDSPQAKALFTLLSKCFAEKDTELFNGAVCIEIDPAEGLVYSVFFCRGDKAELNYRNSSYDYNLLDRRKASRKDHGLVGYYGVRTLSMASDLYLGKPKIESLQLNNEKTLNLSYKVSMSGAASKLTYQIYIYGKSDGSGAADESGTPKDKRLVGIRLNRLAKSDATDAAVYNLKSVKKGEGNTSVPALLADCEVTKFYSDAEGNEKTGEKRYMTFPAWIDTDGRVTLVLDAVDLNTASESMQTKYYNYLATKTAAASGVGGGAGVAGSVPGAGKFVDGLTETFSIYRLGIEDVDNIYCTVQGSGGNYSATDVKKSNEENRAFADSETENHKFGIKNGRHLYNVRFEETAASFEEKGGTRTSENYTYTIENDFSWKDIAEPKTEGDTKIGYIYGIDPSLFKSITGSAAALAETQNSGENTGENSGENSGEESSVPTNTVATIGKAVWTRVGENSQENIVVEEKAAAFPSLVSLRKKSVLTSKQPEKLDASEPDGRIYKIRDLVISKEHNDNWIKGKNAGGTEPAQETESTGLVLSLEGKLSHINLENVKVTGEKNTGAFCGINGGTVEKLFVSEKDYVILDKNVKGESIISGTEQVGGIMGSWDYTKLIGDGNNSLTLSGLTNGATVKGEKFVGGILGSLALKKGENVNLKVSKCTNTGAVLGRNISEKGDKPSFIGGITGLLAKPGDNGSVEISECKSVPKLTAEQESANGKLSDKESYCTGGIAGFCYKGKIKNCSTGDGTDKEKGRVTGGTYAGGIAGLFAGGILECDGTSILTNYNDVTGSSYVGGIVGANCLVKLKDGDDSKTLAAWIKDQDNDWYNGLSGSKLVPDRSRNENNEPTVQNWNNAGNVKADGNYAGGVAGYNGGYLRGINSSQLGGIQEISGTVGGDNFVGGITGYNSTGASVSQYRYTGASVTGKGSFVGGYIGLNCSNKQDLHMDTASEENKKTVIKGVYCVGGIAGGNITHYTESKAMTASTLKGSVTASGGAAGGFIGYNKSLDSAFTEDEMFEKTGELAKTLNSKAEKNDYSGVMKLLATAIDLGDNTSGQMEVLDSKSSNSQSQGSVSGGVFVGGYIGYSADNTVLVMKGLSNSAAVSADSYLYDKWDQLYNIPKTAKAEVEPAYSFVGGIIGYVGRNITLNGCANTGKVTGASHTGGYITYTGGLCEINLGQLVGCSVYSADIGVNKKNVGGLCGINFGNITSPEFKTDGALRGGSGTGGIASMNCGAINIDTRTVGTINVEGASGSKGVGGIAGYNSMGKDTTYKGVITLDGVNPQETSDDASKTLNVSVKSDGESVGGLVGENSGGTIEGSSTGTRIKATVSGTRRVGGVVGHATYEGDALRITGIVTESGTEISASGDGFAGGIVGESESDKTLISRCENNGKITSKTNAGGIIGYVYQNQNDDRRDIRVATLSELKNFGEVTAGTEGAGGIVGENWSHNLQIDNCINKGNIASESDEKTHFVGGIIGKSNGQENIYRCRNYGLVRSGTKNASGIAPDFNVMVDCFDFRTNSDSILTVVEDAGKEPTDSYFWGSEIQDISGTVDDSEKKVLDDYRSKKKTLENVKNKFSSATRKLELAKKGLPVCISKTGNATESVYGLTSYLVWDKSNETEVEGIYNPMFEIGIPKDNKKIRLTGDNIYDVLENNSNGYLQEYYKAKTKTPTAKAVTNAEITISNGNATDGSSKIMSVSWDKKENAYGYKLVVTAKGTSSSTDEILFASGVVPGTLEGEKVSWKARVPSTWMGRSLNVAIRAADGNELPYDFEQWKNEKTGTDFTIVALTINN